MGNWLNLKCPACGDADRIDIAATLWVRVTAEDTDADASETGDHEYGPHSPALCTACGRSGRMRDFEEADPELVRQLAATLRRAVVALNTKPRFGVPALETDSYRIASECDRLLKRVDGT